MKMLSAVLLAAVMLVALPAAAKEVEGVKLDDTISSQGQDLKLKGAGLRKKWFFNVYVIGLYVADPAKNVFDDQAKAVRLVLMRDLGADKISEAISDGFEKNSKADLPKLQERLDKLTKAVPAVKKGEQLTLTYVPGKGTVMTSGSKELVTLEGKDFADALLNVWLGKNPADDDLKKAMLGKAD